MKISSSEFRITKWKIITVSAVIILIGWVGFQIFSLPLNIQKEVVIKEGEGVYAIADTLKAEGVIKNKFIFVIYTLVTGNERKLQMGRYIFTPGVTVPVIIYSMTKGLAEPNDIEVTIPEGANIWEIDKILTRALLTERGEFVWAARRHEGRLFPDTYRFENSEFKTINQKEIEDEMLNNFGNKTRDLFRSLNTQEQEEVIIVASVLEKEAKTEEDMRLVAGVIKNRLEKRMPLQVDATVSYGVCLREFFAYAKTLADRQVLSLQFKYCDVSQVPVGVEIAVDGPYNTYTRVGLPPGPIANPGVKAVQAVLNPQKSDYLYYLSTRDGSQIIFSKTVTEHTANRRKYLGI